MRADLFLVEHGHATTRSQAQRLIASGVQWRADADNAWKKIAKNGDEIADGAEIDVPDATEAKYISRGGLKLEGVLHKTGVDVTGLRCLDIGQSTGGFTDCLLQHGAAEVVGVDVGHGQLHASLREDARVTCLEGINARSLTAIELIAACARIHWAKGQFDAENRLFDDVANVEDDVSAEFDFLTGDLSFISLTLVLPAVVRLLKPAGELLMLVKPHFELQPGQVGKGGIVRDEAMFAVVEKRLRESCAALGLDVIAWLDSPITGGDGNREFFIHARRNAAHVISEEPLATAPPRKAPKRLPRTLLREPHEDPDAAHAGQPGPARSRRRVKPDTV